MNNRGGKDMNKKAQALVEFVLILPVLIILLFAIIDFGNIFINKSNLEADMDIATKVLRDSTDVNTLQEEIKAAVSANDKTVKVEVSFDETDYVKITLIKEIRTITPGLNLILGYPYKATSERVVNYVEQ